LPIEKHSQRRCCWKDRTDLVVANAVIVEVKAVRALAPIHEAQLLTYLKLTGVKGRLLINFNVEVLKSGSRRMVH